MKEEVIRASVAYNEKMEKIRVFGGSAILSEEEYITFNKNPDFIAGAEWMKRQMIDKACEWLENLYAPDGSIIPEHIRILKDFRKAMEDEK